ncbi:protein-glutamine glutaminase family protein [Embleya sp. NPDC001921]
MKRDRDLNTPSSQGVEPIERGPEDDTKRQKLTNPSPDTEPGGDAPVIVPAGADVPGEGPGDGPGIAAADTPAHTGAAAPATVPGPGTGQPGPIPETEPAPQPFRFQRAPGFLAAEKAEKAEEERRRRKAEAEAAAAAKSRGPGTVAGPKVSTGFGSRAGVVGQSEQGPGQFTSLSRSSIAVMPLDRITAAIEKRHEDFGGLTLDMGALTFRQSALGLCANLSLARSIGCVARVRSWLETQADLVPELIVLCERRVTALALPAGPPPSVAELIGVWTQLTGALITPVPERESQDGCEFLAHAVCEWIESTHPHWAGSHLSKRWVVAPTGTMHPPYNWNHHVAPQLLCTEGTFVIDLLLGPRAPMAAAAWAVAAKGRRPPADVFEQTAPWEFLGAPASATADLDPEMLSPIGDTILANIAAWRRV